MITLNSQKATKTTKQLLQLYFTSVYGPARLRELFVVHVLNTVALVKNLKVLYEKFCLQCNLHTKISLFLSLFILCGSSSCFGSFVPQYALFSLDENK